MSECHSPEVVLFVVMCFYFESVGRTFRGYLVQFDGGVKMATYSRSQLCMLLLSAVSLCGFASVVALKAASGPADAPNQTGLKAAEPPAKDAPVAAAAAAGASQPRRASGWKLSEEEACRGDLTRLCPKHTWTNNLAVLECLQDRREVSKRRGLW